MRFGVSKGIPAGVYTARYDGGEEITTANGNAYKLEFSVVGGDHDGRKVSRLVNPGAASPKSNIAKFFAAMAGVSPEDAEDIDDADFKGVEYSILVADGNNGYSKIERILNRVGSQPAEHNAPF